MKRTKLKFNNAKLIPDKYCRTVSGMKAPVNIKSISIWERLTISHMPAGEVRLSIE